MGDINFVEVDRDAYAKFKAWAVTQEMLVGHTVTVCEPILEIVHYASATSETLWDLVVCKAWRVDPWPDVGAIDPRPEDQRPTSWWYDNCRIRQDWHQRWEEAAND